MSRYYSIPILGLAAILQATLTPQFSLLGGRPDLVFLLVLCWAMGAALDNAVVWAFVGGIAQDLLSATPTGTSVIGLVLLVFAVDTIKRQVFRIGPVLALWITLIGTLAYQVLTMILLSLLAFRINILDSLGYVVLPTLVYNAAGLLPIWWLVRRLQKRLPARARTPV